MQTPEKGTQFGDVLLLHTLLFASIDRNCTIHRSPDSDCQDKRDGLCNLHIFGKTWNFLLIYKLCNLCPARSAGFFNPLTRKIVFVRACGVRACVCTPFPYCDFATFHFLLEKRRNRRFSNKK